MVSSRVGAVALNQLAEKVPMADLLDAGLWVYPKGKTDPHPCSAYCGWGIAGKKPKSERRNLANGKPDPKDKFYWKCCYPILIPYFDVSGKLHHIRPHKGGLKGEKPKLYIPRVRDGLLEGTRRVEQYDTVVALEGEFKATACWEVFGAGKHFLDGAAPRFDAPALSDSNTLGVCALPGITMSHNWAVRQELFDWIKAVRAERVFVAFDNEDKTSLRLPDVPKTSRSRLISVSA